MQVVAERSEKPVRRRDNAVMAALALGHETRRSAIWTCSNPSPSTSQRRSPASSIASNMARSRCVRSAATSRSASSGGKVRGTRTSGAVRDRTDPPCRRVMSDQDVLSGSDEDPAASASAGLSPPGPEDLLGRRIAAALIDMAGLAGLGVIMSVATGQTTVSNTGFMIYLDAAWTGVLTAVALLYYFALEAWAGQTLGKLLLDLRVRHVAGTRPSVRAVALRTLLRIIDWLPLLYLAGFITTLATGTRRQRIGDLAARTMMARAGRPARNRGLALLPLAGVVLAAIVLPLSRSASAGGTQTYHAHGASFAYPAGWSAGSEIGGTSTGNLLWTTAVGPGTPHDLIVVESFRLRTPVTAQNIGAVVPDLAGLLQRSGVTPHGSPQVITMGGLPAVQFHIGGPGGSSSNSTVVFAFNGTTEYFVNCQYTPALASDVQHACDQVVSTFHVG